MANRKQKFYVVWDGAEDGVFTSWEACQQAVSGYSNAKYKSFKSEEEAEEAFELGYEAYCEKVASKEQEKEQQQEATNTEVKAEENAPKPNEKEYTLPPAAINEAIAVDAACSGNPGAMEYRGVYLRTGKEIFHYGPVFGTNNIGEFLAIVHGLALLKQKGLHNMPIYSDSVNAQLWVRKRKCKTTLERNEKTEQLHQMIERAEAWLHNNTYANPIIKWPTEEWGEIPADFGRK
ncbi:MAG: ribonuclease H family protein [Prevotellaceae bacterium]|nr:ribonuclease H family protein [Candidatus Minthosoma caballi]